MARINARVTVRLSRDEVADIVGLSPGEVVDWGNGYAVVNPKPAKKTSKKAEAPEPEVAAEADTTAEGTPEE